MKNHRLILKVLLLFSCLAFAGCHKQPETGADAAAPEAAQTHVERDPAVVAYEKQNQLQIERALQRQRDAHPMAAAEAQTPEFRQQVELNTSGAWSAFLGKHMAAFLELRKRAGRSPSKTEPCTICDGRGKLDSCIICKGSGKCPTCRGTGRFGVEICPTCLGRGKCFACIGTGTMQCPFCDDGLVYAGQPTPHLGMPGLETPSAPRGREVVSIQPKVKDDEVSVAVENQSVKTGENETQQTRTSGFSTLQILGLILAAILAWRLMAARVGDVLCEQFNPWTPEERASAEQLAEDRSFEAFATSFRGSRPAPSAEAVRVEPPALSSPKKPEPEPLQNFYARALEEIGGLRKLFTRIGWCNDASEKRQIFEELLSRSHAFKEMADLPERKALWQVSATLEGLLNHLVVRPDKLTPSCLRTAMNAVDLLTDLCAPGVRPCLANDPPARLLAVDDDAISRVAVSNALKRVFSQPELAADGPSALEIATGKRFDVIFLDIEMPGMTGFELCAKLREMPENERTPIVFVTSHSDFNSRAQIPLIGAQDLIAKPFFSFEVALKALTFVMRGRLAEDGKFPQVSPDFSSQSVQELSATVSPQGEPACLPPQAFAAG